MRSKSLKGFMEPKTQHIRITREVAEFLAMHSAWLEAQGYLIATKDYSPYTRSGYMIAVVSGDFRNFVDRIVIHEKTDFSNATYLAVMRLIFAPEGTDINDL
jgi:hypothetical protein